MSSINQRQHRCFYGGLLKYNLNNVLADFGATVVRFLLRRVQKAFFPKCDLFMSNGNKRLGGWVSANTVSSVVRQYRCVLLLGGEERKEGGVRVLHCRRG